MTGDLCVSRSRARGGGARGDFRASEILPVPIARSAERRHRLCQPSVLALS
ncbi:MAG: hypothetical protein KME26_12020 [Oscillatoria princeps RMCB-10]|nr:hypothetical protein [Oscillatoria princeps RMCB-10]